MLIVDDDPVQLKLMRLAYECADFQVGMASNGADALTMAETFAPDIIVSDILMPVLDGFQLCYAVRQHPALNCTPLLLISANYVEASDRVFTERLGASGYIAREEGLKSIVKRTLDILDSDQVRENRGVDGLELDAEHYLRVANQLERQACLHTACVQRAAVQGAILHELSVISETLARSLDFDASMEEILAHCLDGAGLSKGALYLFMEGQLRLRAQYGLSETLQAAQNMFEEPALCEQFAIQEDPLVLPGRGLPGPQADRLLSRARQLCVDRTDSFAA